VASQAECEAACSIQAECTGYEINGPPLSSTTKCEIHTSPDDFHHTAPVDGCSCFARQLASTLASLRERHEAVNGDGRGSGVSSSVNVLAVMVLMLVLIVIVSVVIVGFKRRAPLGAGDTSDALEWDDVGI
jgi:hypothetical protein